MKPDFVLNIHGLYGEKTLAGSINGQTFFAKLLAETAQVPRDSIIALDLGKVDLVTASFFRVAFKAFRDHARSTSSLYPIIVNANSATKEEATFFLESASDVLLFAALAKDQELVSPTLLGKLDNKQVRTLSALIELKEADAGQLLDTYPEQPPVSSAAWSNRLAALATKGIIAERLVGRNKKYRPILEGIEYGS